MFRAEITRKPVTSVNCPKCPRSQRGILCRVDLSRLEEGLGHEGFRCDRCGHEVKYVPPAYDG